MAGSKKTKYHVSPTALLHLIEYRLKALGRKHIDPFPKMSFPDQLATEEKLMELGRRHIDPDPRGPEDFENA